MLPFLLERFFFLSFSFKLISDWSIEIIKYLIKLSFISKNLMSNLLKK